MEEEDYNDSGPIPVQQLETVGINNNDIKKLEEAGLLTIEAVMYTTKKALTKVKGLSENKVAKIMAACDKLCP